MLKRIVFILVIAMAMPMASPVFANPIADSAVSQLRNQGYNDIQVQRTLLGRIRITATSKTNSRELIIHPITGEIMRDRWTLSAKTASSPAPIAINPEGNDGDGGAGNGSGGDGDGGDSGDGGDGGDSGDGGDGGDSGDGGDGGDSGDGGDGDHD
ncbi:hypothetical protein [Profundibacter sp.]